MNSEVPSHGEDGSRFDDGLVRESLEAKLN